MIRIGIMQGRLTAPADDRIQVFPGAAWRDEFPRAAEAGLTHIEWIYDIDSAKNNPLCTENGIEDILAHISKHNVKVISLCADYFMVHGFLRVTPAEFEAGVDHFTWLAKTAHRIGVRRIVLPFVDQAAIDNAGEATVVVDLCHRLAPILAAHEMELHLETSLGPLAFRDLMARVGHVNVRINYDTGNSSGIGYDPVEELSSYGHWIGSVHIKDRKLGGTTFPLGEGSADFARFFPALVASGYSGDFILQVARGAAGDEVGWAQRNRGFVEKMLNEVAWTWS